MTQVMIDKNDIRDIQNYMHNPKIGFVKHMNDAGLTGSAMCFILDTLFKKCNEVLTILESDDEE